MIELSCECVVSLTEAAKELPKRRGGRKIHVSTLYRWSQRGLKGVFLETIQIGGTLCTSVEALQRFFDELGSVNKSRNPQNYHTRSKEIERAELELGREGI